MSRVVLAARAEEDLFDIAVYIAQDNPEAAARFIEKIEQICALLAASPEIGRLRSELAEDVRSFPVERYVIFYLPVKGGIEVLRVLHGARDIPSIF
ncbi:MAG: type II toxin-antitoxin system RelE/ParE family toxin [Acidobacteria bacterium]|nr:type II toxin-antitoxin system RelE/ParE family toxin [Acidobacteriota bacterium]